MSTQSDRVEIPMEQNNEAIQLGPLRERPTDLLIPRNTEGNQFYRSPSTSEMQTTAVTPVMMRKLTTRQDTLMDVRNCITWVI